MLAVHTSRAVDVNAEQYRVVQCSVVQCSAVQTHSFAWIFCNMVCM